MPIFERADEHLLNELIAIALVQLPQKLVGIAARNPDPKLGALQAQVAVAVEILLMTAIRIINLAALDTEQNFNYAGHGKATHLIIEPDEMKNEETVDFPLPDESIELIQRYLREFRPRLAPHGGTAFFPGHQGRPKAARTLRQQISDTIHSYTGLRMHPHLFHHTVAKLYLDANPGSYAVVRRFLVHRSIKTTTDFYTGEETAAAVRLLDKTILDIRNRKNLDD